MIKFATKGADGKILIGLGLEERNIQRLKEKEPILFNAINLDPNLANYEILIFWGETQEDIVQEMKEFGFKVPENWRELKNLYDNNEKSGRTL